MMPDRIIRDDLLDSDRYLGLSSDTARMLFIHLVLAADDLGNTEASPLFIRRRLLASPLEDQVLVKLLSELADSDLIRLYEVEGKRYAHIPRFGQRLRYMKGQYPRPPQSMECKKIRELLAKKTDHGPTTDRPQSAEVKRSEEKKNNTSGLRRSAKTSVPEGFVVSDRVRAWATETGVFNVDAHFQHFVNACKAKDYRYADWDRAFMNAITQDWARLGKGVNPAQPRRVAL